MEEKNLIRTDTDEFSGVIVERSKRRKRTRPLLKIIIITLIIVTAVVVIYNYYPAINDFFNSFKAEVPPQNTQNSYTPPSNLVDDNKQNEESAPPPATIPEDAYPIYEETIIEHTIINESICNLEFTKELSFPQLDEIYAEFGKDAPVVLITHFSVRECYSNGSYYFTDDNFYSDEKNVGELGNLMCSMLNEIGINAIHLNEVYASGAIFTSQKEYNSALSDTLKKYPSISYVINLTRNASVKKDLSINKYVTYIDNQPCAQLNIISGTGYDTMTEGQENNLAFALSLGKYINQDYLGLVKSNVVSRFSLSQDYEPICFELELGGYGNSYTEVENSVKIFSSAFYEFLNKE